MSKIFALVLVLVSMCSAFASGIGDCVFPPSKIRPDGYTVLTKAVLLTSHPGGGKIVRQMDLRTAIVVNKQNGYILLANVPEYTDTDKQCYMLGWVKDGVMKYQHPRNCTQYDDICNGGD